jgi:hypothetical protein
VRSPPLQGGRHTSLSSSLSGHAGSRRHPTDTTTGLGWLVYAAVMLSLSALLNIVWGIIALADNYYWGGQSPALDHPGWAAVVIGADLLVTDLLVIYALAKPWVTGT